MEDTSLTTLIIGSLVAVALLSILFLQSQAKKKSTVQARGKNPGSSRRELKKYTKAEVAKHCTEEDAWIIVDGKVYDITFYDIHPGGDAILRNVGGDSSVGFHGSQHPPSVWDVITEFHIGELVEEDKEKKEMM